MVSLGDFVMTRKALPNKVLAKLEGLKMLYVELANRRSIIDFHISNILNVNNDFALGKCFDYYNDILNAAEDEIEKLIQGIISFLPTSKYKKIQDALADSIYYYEENLNEYEQSTGKRIDALFIKNVRVQNDIKNKQR